MDIDELLEKSKKEYKKQKEYQNKKDKEIIKKYEEEQLRKKQHEEYIKNTLEEYLNIIEKTLKKLLKDINFSKREMVYSTYKRSKNYLILFDNINKSEIFIEYHYPQEIKNTGYCGIDDYGYGDEYINEYFSILFNGKEFNINYKWEKNFEEVLTTEFIPFIIKFYNIKI